MDIEMSGKWGKDPFLELGEGIVFIGNIQSPVIEQQICYALGNIGHCSWCHMVSGGRGGVFLGYAYAKFEDDKAAQAFVDDHKKIDVINEGVSLFVMRSEIGVCTEFHDAGKLAVTGVSNEITEEALVKLFGEYGRINSIEMSIPGHVIVHFSTEWDAKQCKTALDGAEVDGNKLTVVYYDQHPKFFPLHSKRIVLHPFNFERDLDNEGLKEKFSFLGQVYARVERNADGSSRGCGYVYFDKPSADTPIMSSCNAFETVNGHTILVRVGGSPVHAGHPKREEVPPLSALKFHPSAMPKGPQGLHVIPPEHRQYANSIETCDMSPEAELSAAYLGAFTIHITNLGVLSEEEIREMFAKYGEVTLLLNKADDETLERYALITFMHHGEATEAVREIRRENAAFAEEDRIRVELMDVYHYFHNEHIKRLLQKEMIVNPNSQFTQQYGAPMINQGPVSNMRKMVGAQNGVLQKQPTQATAEKETSDEKNKQFQAEQPNSTPPQQLMYPMTGGGPMIAMPYYYQHPPSYYAPVFSQPPQMAYRPDACGPSTGQYFYPSTQRTYQPQLQQQIMNNQYQASYQPQYQPQYQPSSQPMYTYNNQPRHPGQPLPNQQRNQPMYQPQNQQQYRQPIQQQPIQQQPIQQQPIQQQPIQQQPIQQQSIQQQSIPQNQYQVPIQQQLYQGPIPQLQYQMPIHQQVPIQQQQYQVPTQQQQYQGPIPQLQYQMPIHQQSYQVPIQQQQYQLPIQQQQYLQPIQHQNQQQQNQQQLQQQSQPQSQQQSPQPNQPLSQQQSPLQNQQQPQNVQSPHQNQPLSQQQSPMQNQPLSQQQSPMQVPQYQQQFQQQPSMQDMLMNQQMPMQQNVPQYRPQGQPHYQVSQTYYPLNRQQQMLMQQPLIQLQQQMQQMQASRPQEKFRAKIIEKIAALFQRSSETERADMLQAALQVPMTDLNDMLAHDHTFRTYFIRKAVAAARNKKK